ncbi:hypothetical protein PFHG_03908 [Plasmodium falciparum HB3]|uniref:Uncharacterized protein n=1 Tax=Plasmodium falciparum (isolate HB3) TaxID=137071 RepID=A0A0L7KGF3_PLAFX|nr:hypothetical protein PFHG_03908 [Plasmodium falciparum HB3]
MEIQPRKILSRTATKRINRFYYPRESIKRQTKKITFETFIFNSLIIFLR